MHALRLFPIVHQNTLVFVLRDLKGYTTECTREAIINRELFVHARTRSVVGNVYMCKYCNLYKLIVSW